MQQSKLKELIEALFAKLSLDIQSVNISQLTEQEWYCNIESGDERILLSGKGEVLRSLQHLLKSLVRAKGWLEEGEMIKFDVCGYRKRQEDNIHKLTEEKSDHVLSTGQPVILPPMSPYFRRLVHLDVAKKFPKLTSESQGIGSYRSVKIFKK